GGAPAATAMKTAQEAPANSGAQPVAPNAAENQLSPFGKGGLPGVSTELYQAGFDANWEIDVFGGNPRPVQGAHAQVEAAVEARRAVLVTMLAEVGRNYLELRGTQERMAIIQENITTQTNVLGLIRSLRMSGLATDFDVTRAVAQLAITRSTLPPLERQI